MSMIKEFKEFASKGNVVDMAVGVVIGGAFGKIVASLVEKIIMPITGFLTQGVNVADLSYKIPLPEALVEKGMKPATLGYGAFAQSIIDFIIVAFAIFLMVKVMNAAKKKEPPAAAVPPPPSNEERLLVEIRDLLKAKK